MNVTLKTEQLYIFTTLQPGCMLKFRKVGEWEGFVKLMFVSAEILPKGHASLEGTVILGRAMTQLDGFQTTFNEIFKSIFNGTVSEDDGEQFEITGMSPDLVPLMMHEDNSPMAHARDAKAWRQLMYACGSYKNKSNSDVHLLQSKATLTCTVQVGNVSYDSKPGEGFKAALQKYTDSINDLH